MLLSKQKAEDKNLLMRNIPSVDLILNREKIRSLMEENGKEEITDIVREVLRQIREEIISGVLKSKEEVSAGKVEEMTVERVRLLSLKKLQKTINATGVVIHTNLGRAPLSETVVRNSLKTIQNYSNLEYDLESGGRGSRHDYLRELIIRLTGAEDAIVVNNNAAAVLLILSTFAKDKEVIVSRGELVEIGGSFRIPSVMSQGGARLIEVGTTNKTHEEDYEQAINENTALLMKIHTSNYDIVGFTKSVEIENLKKISEKHGIPLVEDLGSGVLVDLRKYGIRYEPTVQDSVRKGADIVSFSGDKLLGGPQAGIIIGKREYIARMKKNQLLRALRVDKVIISLLYQTFLSYFDEELMKKNIPVMQMLSLERDTIYQRAEKLRSLLHSPEKDFRVEICPCKSQVGGGSLPTEEMESWGIFISSPTGRLPYLERELRLSEEHIISRIQNDRLILDMRTVFDEDIVGIADCLNGIWGGNQWEKI